MDETKRTPDHRDAAAGGDYGCQHHPTPPDRTGQGYLHPPAVSSSATSCEAARCIRGHAARQRQLVLRFFIERGAHGGTDEEAQLALGLKPQSETPRRVELVRLLLVRDSGRRRRTSSGRSATVWAVTTAADTAGGAAT